MKKMLSVLLLVLCSNCLFFDVTNAVEYSAKDHPAKKCIFASASYFAQPIESGYGIDIFQYPGVGLLSINKNAGFTKGHIKTTSEGIKIVSSGDYFVNFHVVFSGTNDEIAPIAIVYVVKDDQFNPLDSTVISDTVVIIAGRPITAQNAGILRNLKKGTTLKLFVSNRDDVGSATVASWTITAQKICDKH